MGSYWAYYELGWGGWWFWDPVENASLHALARRHGAAAFRGRDGEARRAEALDHPARDPRLLAVAARHVPGALGRAHVGARFATDPTRGVFILAILVLFIGGCLALYAWRAPLLKQGGLFAPISREGMLVLNNLFLTTACATVFTGTLYPLALEALTGAKISVGAPYFNLTFAPLFLPLLVAVPFGPLMAWKRGDLLGAGQRLFGALALALVAVAASFAIAGAKSMLAPFVIGLAFFVMAGAVSELAERTQLFRLPAASALARARGLPRSAWGTALAHFGLGVSLLGIVCETQWGAERIASVKPGQTLELRGYELRFDGLEQRQGPNYRELAGRFTVRRDGETIAVMEPAKRSFPARENATTEAALMTRGFSQLYLSLGDAGRRRRDQRQALP